MEIVQTTFSYGDSLFLLRKLAVEVGIKLLRARLKRDGNFILINERGVEVDWVKCNGGKEFPGVFFRQFDCTLTCSVLRTYINHTHPSIDRPFDHVTDVVFECAKIEMTVCVYQHK